jgi:hypothetical protein
MVLRFGVWFLVTSTVNDTVVHSFYFSGKIRLLIVLFLTDKGIDNRARYLILKRLLANYFDKPFSYF